MGEMFNIRFAKIRSGGLHVWKFFYHLKTLGWTCGCCAVDGLPRAHWAETEFIDFQHVLKFPEVPVYQC